MSDGAVNSSNYESLSAQQQHTYTDRDDKKTSLNTKRAICRHCCRVCCFWSTGVITLFMTIQAIFLPQFISNLVKESVISNVIYTHPLNGNTNYDRWVSTAIEGGYPIWLEIRAYNITNPYDVMYHGATPQLQIVGPLG